MIGKVLAVKSDNSTHNDTPGGGVWLKISVCVKAVDFRCRRHDHQALEAVWKEKKSAWACRY